MAFVLCKLGREQGIKLSFTHRKFNSFRTLKDLNRFGVDLLPDNLNRRLFLGVKCKPPDEEQIEFSLSELEKFGLNSPGLKINLPDITNLLPVLKGRNVLDHFSNIGKQQTQPYLSILSPLLNASVPPAPRVWRIEPGWIRYGFDGSIERVNFPLEAATVFDVEVSVKTDPRAVLAVACSSLAWYSWLSPHFLSDDGFPSTVTPSSMIPLGSDSLERIVIGHNVSYDRIRLGDEYLLDRSGTRFLDTMSMHIALSGMTSSQRMMKQAEKNMEDEGKPTWLKQTSMNSLADVHNFYCKPENRIEKDVRDSFVKLSLAELREDIPNLLNYCAGDVQATLEVSKELVPRFLRAFPHPVTLSGMLTMSTSYLPTNSCWKRYLEDADAAYDVLEKTMLEQLEKEVKSSAALIKGTSYTQDPWLWDLDWKPASLRTRKRRFLNMLINDDSFTDEDNKFPTWFQDLADEEDGTAFLNISTSKRVVPKILRLTWKGFPLHFDKTEKWGYLAPVPDVEDILECIENGEIGTKFPLKEYMASLENWKSVRNTDPTDIFVDQIPDYSDNKYFKKSAKSDKAEAGKNIGLPGVLFYKLPHKNGPRFRVGNPLGKDFLSACGEGGALASKIKDLAGELLKTSSQLAYWRNAKDRLLEQVKVDLPVEDLPEVVRSDPAFDTANVYSAIIPSLVVSGTVTRRAVEKTWLTASNARKDRVGSELKTAIRAPPGFHFVGADVDSQELWLASLLGDAERGGHGSTPLGWMSLQGERSKGTDLHSKTAAAAQVSRDQAKILNYARIYGAGEQFARLLLKQFNPDLTDVEVSGRARHMYEQTKGLRGYKLNVKGKWLYDFLFQEEKEYNGAMVSKKMMNILAKRMVFINRVIEGSRTINHKGSSILVHQLTEEAASLYHQFTGSSPSSSASVLLDDEKLREFYLHLEEKFGDTSHSDFDVLNSLIQQTVWFGGSESHTFNKLEEIAMSTFPQTPVLGANISKALDSRLIGRNYLPSRINWVVQSTAVDFLHLLLSSIEWFFVQFNIKGRFVISIHDEVRYMVQSEDRYKAALALHLSNLLVRAHVAASLGLNNLPATTAFFSSVDVDTVLRKEPNSDCETPSNPLGLEQGHGVPFGEGLDIFQVIEKLQIMEKEDNPDIVQSSML